MKVISNTLGFGTQAQILTTEQKIALAGGHNWSKQAVNAYKAEEIKKAKRQWWQIVLSGVCLALVLLLVVVYAAVELLFLGYESLYNRMKGNRPYTKSWRCFSNEWRQDSLEFVSEKVIGRFLWYPKLTWQRSCVEERGRYYHNSDFRPLPESVMEVRNKLLGFFPKARFEVAYLGDDPILTMTLERGTADYDYYHVLVWDEVQGEVVIVKPPA